MVLGKTRRIVVIKDIPSNVIEEAILILKSEPDCKEAKDCKGESKGNKKKNNDYLLKEARYIINDYIKESKLAGASGIDLNLREVGASKKKFLLNVGINLAVLSGIALLIFVVVKMI